MNKIEKIDEALQATDRAIRALVAAYHGAEGNRLALLFLCEHYHWLRMTHAIVSTDGNVELFDAIGSMGRFDTDMLAEFLRWEARREP